MKNSQPFAVWLMLSFLSTVTVATQVIYVNRSSPNAVNTSECWKGGLVIPCSTFELGIAGLHNFLKGVKLVIAEAEYNFTNIETGHFINVNGISIIGKADGMNGNPNPVNINCFEGVGFSFINCSFITISGIIFNGCSQLQNSTSLNYTTNNTFSLFKVCLYFLYCRNVNLTNVTVENTEGVGVVLYNIGGNSVIESCEFLRNQFQNNNMSGGGGVYIEYSYCVPTASGKNCLSTGDTNINNSYISGANFFIQNSSFKFNKANISNFAKETFILPHKQYHAAFGRGGGFSAFFKGDSHDISITIENCVFFHNHALWGGGIFIEFQDKSYNNIVSVISSNVSNNSLFYNDTRNEGTGGGGSRVGFIFYDDFVSHNNLIIFDSCHFIHNDAYYGGGVSFYTAKPPNDTLQNTFVLKNCDFRHNSAKLGSAIDLSVWHPSVFGMVPQTSIKNCNFVHNYPDFESHQGGLIGAGAVYADGIQLKLSGIVHFLYNQGSALAVTGSFVEMLNNSDVSFHNNTGRNGGAIALLGNAFILTHYNASLSFFNNSAYYLGGAIYSFSSGERNLISSRNCMIRFINIDYQPINWTSSFIFGGNTANHTPNAIYASTILPCVWGGAEGSTVNDDQLDKNVFCWNDHWIYYDSNNTRLNCSVATKNLISTAPSKFSTDLMTSYSVVPGEEANLKLPVFDDMNNNVTDSVTFIARILDLNNGASFTGHYDYTHVSHEDLRLEGKPNTTIQVKIETMDPIVIQNNIKIHFLKCPPGFENPSNEKNYCQCSKQQIYNNYVHCYQSTFSITIVRTIWIGKVNISGIETEVAGGSPYISSVGNGQFVTLDKSHNDPDEVFCNKFNRRGALCGKCIENYGVAVNSEEYTCIHCDDDKAHYGWIFYLLSEYLPVTILFAIIFMFSITLTFGPLNSFIFFAQVITTVVKVNADGMIYLNTKGISYETLKSFYMVPYDIWNMNFFRFWIPRFCLNDKMDTLDIMSLELIQAIYPLLLLIVFVSVVHLYSRGVPCIVRLFRPFHRCIARFRQWTNLRRSITGGMAVFIIISYTKFTLVSILLLTPAPLYYSNDSVAEQVYYYAGNINYQKYTSHSISAGIALLIFGIIPPILLFYPTLLKLINRLSCNHLNVGKLSPPLKLQAFLDEFHGCYKDGMEGGLDCRWFASLYFCLRIILFAIYASTEHWYTQYTVQILLFLFTAILIALLQPYRKAWINAVDMSMFILLAAISSISMLNLFRTWIGKEPQMWAFIFQYVLIFIPLIYCIAYYSTMLYMRTKSKCMKKRSGGETLLEQTEDGSDSSSFVNSTHIPNFLDYMEDTERMRSRIRMSNSQQRRNRIRRVPGSIDHLGNINSSETSSENTPLLTHASSNTGTTSTQGETREHTCTESENGKREAQKGIVKRRDEDGDNDVQVNFEAHHNIPIGNYEAV